MTEIYVNSTLNNESSMQKQKIKCERYAKENNLTTRIYTDIHLLLSDPNITDVIVTSYHRLARSSDILYPILNLFEERNINLRASSPNLQDPDLLISEILFAIKTFHENKIINI